MNPDPIKRVLSNTDDAAAIARMQARLEASLGAEFDRQVQRPSAPRAASQLQRLRWIGAGAIVAVGVAFWSLRQAAPPPPLPAAETSTLAPAELPSHPEQPTVPAPAPQPAVSQRAESQLAVSQPAESQPAESQPVVSQPAVSQRAESQPAVSQPAAAHKPQLMSRRAVPPQPSASKSRTSSAAPSSKPTPSESAAPRAGLAEELSGLDQIRALLAHSPQRALAAAEAQQAQFARGALSPERALLRLDALLRLGRAAEAQQFAQQLLAAQAHRPYRARILRLLEHAR